MIQIKKISKKLTVFICIFSIFFLPVSCSKKNASADTPLKKVKITAAFYPLYIMCLNITQDIPDVELSLLVPQDTVSFSDYEFTTKDLTIISSCDILVINGAGMEQFPAQTLKLKQNKLITAAENYPLINNNPCIWISPSGARYEVQQTADGLSRLDPGHAAKYRKNAEIYEKKLSSLSNEMNKALTVYKGNDIVTFYEPLGYLAEEFGLNILSVIVHKPGVQPGTKELTGVVRQIKSAQKNNRSICLYAEQQFPSSAEKIIETKTELVINKIDTCSTGLLDPDAYIDAQEKNLLVFMQSLSGNYDDGDNQ
jgi:zinc transport system substrate-binding protein